MSDYLNILTTFGCCLVAVGLGAIAGRRFGQPVEYEPMICGCGHSWAFHDLANDRCHAELRRPFFNSEGTLQLGWRFVPCQCRHYVGPRPEPDRSWD